MTLGAGAEPAGASPGYSGVPRPRLIPTARAVARRRSRSTGRLPRSPKIYVTVGPLRPALRANGLSWGAYPEEILLGEELVQARLVDAADDGRLFLAIPDDLGQGER